MRFINNLNAFSFIVKSFGLNLLSLVVRVQACLALTRCFPFFYQPTWTPSS